MTLQEIKDQVAKDNGYSSWIRLMIDCSIYGHRIESYMDEVCIRAQKQALINAWENSELEWSSPYDCDINKDSITTEKNLVR